MSLKSKTTECSALAWGDFLLLLDRLKRSDEVFFLLFAALGGYTGLRMGDILHLTWTELLKTDSLVIKEGKTGKTRRILLNDALKELIGYCYHHWGRKDKQYKSKGLVFANRVGEVISRQYINRRLHDLFTQYRIKTQNPSSHTLRKTFGRRVYEIHDKSDASLVLLSSIFNHSSTAITRRYIGLTQAQIENVYELL